MLCRSVVSLHICSHAKYYFLVTRTEVEAVNPRNINNLQNKGVMVNRVGRFFWYHRAYNAVQSCTNKLHVCILLEYLQWGYHKAENKDKSTKVRRICHENKGHNKKLCVCAVTEYTRMYVPCHQRNGRLNQNGDTFYNKNKGIKEQPLNYTII